jgi:hypothetical protein
MNWRQFMIGIVVRLVLLADPHHMLLSDNHTMLGMMKQVLLVSRLVGVGRGRQRSDIVETIREYISLKMIDLLPPRWASPGEDELKAFCGVKVGFQSRCAISSLTVFFSPTEQSRCAISSLTVFFSPTEKAI